MYTYTKNVHIHTITHVYTYICIMYVYAYLLHWGPGSPFPCDGGAETSLQRKGGRTGLGLGIYIYFFFISWLYIHDGICIYTYMYTYICVYFYIIHTLYIYIHMCMHFFLPWILVHGCCHIIWSLILSSTPSENSQRPAHHISLLRESVKKSMVCCSMKTCVCIYIYMYTILPCSKPT